MNDTTIEDLLLSWPHPAADWIEAAPVGNGRLGAMVFGGTRRARWQINDSTVWSGTPDSPREGLDAVLAAGAGPQRLAEAREAIRAEDYRRAENLLLTFEGRYSQEYLPLADLWMSLDSDAAADGYQGRALNLDTGLVTEQLGRIRRTTWASRPAGTICIAVTVEQGTTDLTLELTSPLRVVEHTTSDRRLSLGVELPVDGAPLHEPQVTEPLRYAANGYVSESGYDPYAVVAVAVDTDGDTAQSEGALTVRGASHVLITLASSATAADVWSGDEPADRAEHRRRATRRAEAALVLGAERLLDEHELDLRGLLGGMELTIGARRRGTFDVAEDILSGKDEQLTATVIVQLGRYLLAAASRPGGGPPANLQGIWNGELRPPWSSNYTININTQMNYWGAEPAGLGECHEPLFRLIERLAETGAPVARELYGARGWLTHHNTDPWGWALPVGMGHGDLSWALWMMGGVWLSQHLWEHVEYSQDLEFLRDRAWPPLHGCAQFCLDWLVESADGRLDTIPSTSPENKFLSRHGTPESLSASTTMDIAFIRALFTRCLEAADLLGLDDDPVCAEIRAALPRLRQPGLTRDGRLREWAEDHPEQDPHHRHMSQLVTVFPLGQVDPDTTPELATAARQVMDARGPGAMGWSWAWKIALRARLRDAATAHSLLLEAVRPLDGDPDRFADPTGAERWGGLLPNLFSSHPPFQIDGNYGLMAAVLEMLVQSHNAGTVSVLPALPEQWPDGDLRGVRCRGGLAVDLTWRRGALSTLTVRRLRGDGDRPVRIQYRELVRELRVPPGVELQFDTNLDLEPAC